MRIEMPTAVRFRIPPELRDYFSIFSTGLHLVQSTSTLPVPLKGDRVRVRVTLSDEDLSRVDHVARLYGVSRNAAVVAALVWATRSNIYPTRRSEEHTSELQSLMRNSYAVFCLKKKKTAN